MSQFRKEIIKPLKGQQIASNVGIFDELTANNLKINNASFGAPIDSAELEGAIITNSEIDNTVIGSKGPADGFFTDLTVYETLTLTSSNPDTLTIFDPDTGLFYIGGSLQVNGCSLLGNLDICVNTIRAVNTDGNVNIISNNNGIVNIIGDFHHVATYGNFKVDVSSGLAYINAKNDISIVSSDGSFYTRSQLRQEHNILNGDFVINTELDTFQKNLTSVVSTNGQLIITTLLEHNLNVGDSFQLNSASDPILDDVFVVSSIINPYEIAILDTRVLLSNGTSGTILKTPNNDIILNAGRFIKVPDKIPITFGTQGTNIVSDGIDLFLNISSNTPVSPNKIELPIYTKLQYGSSGTSYINLTDENSLNIVSRNINNASTTHTDNTILYINNAENAKFKDPILKFANYETLTNDFKDRGVEFNYNQSSSNMLGWFGYKNSSNKFTFMLNATNSDEVISGELGDFEINNIEASNISLATGGTFNVNCGTISNVNTIIGCHSNINILTTNNTYVSSSNVFIQGSVLQIPNQAQFNLGTSGNYLTENNSDDIVIHSNKNAFIDTIDNIVVNTNKRLTFDGTTTGETSINSVTEGTLVLNSKKDVYLNTTSGAIKIPLLTRLEFATPDQSIHASSSGMNIINTFELNIINENDNINIVNNGADINLLTTPSIGSVRVPDKLVFASSGDLNSIYTDIDSNALIIKGSQSNISVVNTLNIDLNASEFINIPSNTRLHFGNNTDANYIYSNSNDIILETVHTNVSSENVNITTGTMKIISVDGTHGDLLIELDNVKIDDPILTLANNKADLRDRGVEFNYTSLTGGQYLGWLGYKSSEGYFSFLVDATNQDEIITGTPATVELGNAIIRGNFEFSSQGNLNMNCGTISNLNTIIGCEGVLNIIATNVNIPSESFLNLGGSNITDNSGNLFVNTSTFIINGDLQVSGTTANVYSTVTNIEDPIISIGGVTGQLLNDFKDRGIEFKWYDNSTRTGFFGFDNSSGRFVYIKDGVNDNEIFSGAFGDIQASDAYLTNIDIQNGTISNLDTIISDTLNLEILTALLPYDSIIQWGSTNTNLYITGNTLGDMYIKSDAQIILDNTSGTLIPIDTPLYIGETQIINKTSGNTEVTNNIGDIIINGDTNTVYNTYGNMINSDGEQLFLYGYSGVTINGSTVSINGQVNINGSLNVKNIINDGVDINSYILPLGTYQDIQIEYISNTSTLGYLLVTLQTTSNLVAGDDIDLRATNTLPKIDGMYSILETVSPTQFIIDYGTDLTQEDGGGSVRSDLTFNQEKDVGIQVNYWSTTGNQNSTIGTDNFKTGFFGFKLETERWSFYRTSTIQNSIVTGDFGDVEIYKLWTSRISGFDLDGTLNAHNQLVVGDNFDINGGFIDNTPIGLDIPSTGVFTSLTGNVKADINNLTLNDNLYYTFERLSINSLEPHKNPSVNTAVTLISVNGVSFTTGSGTMGNIGAFDGQIKKLVCGHMGNNCSFTVHFDKGTLVSPNPRVSVDSDPSQIVFRRRGQTCELIFDAENNYWIVIGGNGVYIY